LITTKIDNNKKGGAIVLAERPIDLELTSPVGLELGRLLGNKVGSAEGLPENELRKHS